MGNQEGKVSHKTRTILSELRGLLKDLYGPRLGLVTLFGSQARGDATPESDIDVLVVLHGDLNPGEEIERTGEIVSTLSLRYDVVVSCTFVSYRQYLGEQSPFLLNVRREGIAV